MLKSWFAAAMQSLEKVPRSLLKEVGRSPGVVVVQVGSAGSARSFSEGSFRDRSVAGTDRGTALVAKRGFAEQTLLYIKKIRAMRRAR